MTAGVAMSFKMRRGNKGKGVDYTSTHIRPHVMMNHAYIRV